jgi:hypothetical protein
VAETEDACDTASLLALADEVPAHVAARTGKPASPEVREGLDRAVTRVLGDDKGRGSAGLLRAHLAARTPLAAAQLEWAGATVAGKSPGMAAAMAVQRAQAQADAIAACVEPASPPAA